MKKRLPLFYIIYFSLIALFVLSLTIFLIWLKGAVSRYNETLPETISERFYEENFKTPDADRLLSLTSVNINEFETPDTLKKALSEHFSGTMSFTSVSSGDDLVKKYIVKSDNRKCAEFTLVKDASENWIPGNVKLLIPQRTQINVVTLSSSTLFVNGLAANESYICSREAFEQNQYLPENVAGPEWVTYKISDFLYEPDIKVIDRNGKECALVDESGALKEQLIYDDNEEDVSSRILEGAMQYAICMQNDAPKSSVYPYFEEGTDLYSRIKSVENMFVWDHNGYDFEDVEVSEFFRYDETTVSMRVSFTHILKKYGSEDYRNYTDITYFARLIDGKYMIYSCFNN